MSPMNFLELLTSHKIHVVNMKVYEIGTAPCFPPF